MEQLKHPFALVFSGKISTGKSSITNHLSEILHSPKTSFGDYVRRIANENGLSNEREILQNIGQELVNTIPTKFCLQVLDQIDWKGKTFLIEGVRHEKVLHVLKDIIKPTPVYHIHLLLDEKLRIERMGDKSISKVEQFDSHKTESDVLDVFPNIADLCLDARHSIEDLGMILIKWLETKL